MEKTIITLIACLIFLAGALGYLVFYGTDITGEAVSGNYYYSFTKAVCEGESCRDYHIECRSDEFIRMTPTGRSVEMPLDWEDPRSKEEIERLC